MEKIKQIIKEYEEISFEGLPRGYDLELFRLKSALTIIRPRRSGKTTYLSEIIHSLKLKHFLFLNFEEFKSRNGVWIWPFGFAIYLNRSNV
ncbi:MAG: hypothetical protein ACE5IR_12415 [bacterium]